MCFLFNPYMEKNDGALREVLAAKLKALMGEKWTQKDLAKAAGVSQSTVSRMLDQKTSTKIDHVAAVSRVFKLQPWQLLAPTDLTALDLQSTELLDVFLPLPPDLRANFLLGGMRAIARPTNPSRMPRPYTGQNSEIFPEDEKKGGG